MIQSQHTERIQTYRRCSKLCKKFNKLLCISTVVIGPRSGSSSNYEYQTHQRLLLRILLRKLYIYDAIRFKYIYIHIFPPTELGVGKSLEQKKREMDCVTLINIPDINPPANHRHRLHARHRLSQSVLIRGAAFLKRAPRANAR